MSAHVEWSLTTSVRGLEVGWLQGWPDPPSFSQKRARPPRTLTTSTLHRFSMPLANLGKYEAEASRQAAAWRDALAQSEQAAAQLGAHGLQRATPSARLNQAAHQLEALGTSAIVGTLRCIGLLA